MHNVRDLDRLATSFKRHLAAENKSPKTIETYGEGVAPSSSPSPRHAMSLLPPRWPAPTSRTSWSIC